MVSAFGSHCRIAECRACNLRSKLTINLCCVRLWLREHKRLAASRCFRTFFEYGHSLHWLLDAMTDNGCSEKVDNRFPTFSER